MGETRLSRGASSPPARRISSLFQLQQSQSVSGPLVPGVFPRLLNFLSKLRTELYGLHIPKCLKVFKLSAYADDVVIFISCQNDVNLLLKLLKDFRVFSSTKVNWSKSEAILVGRWLGGDPNLPDGLTWTREGLKYLGVFWGNAMVIQKTLKELLRK